MKVYCENCKWVSFIDFCHLKPIPAEIPDSYYFGDIRTHISKESKDERTIRAYLLNRYNNCPHYKRKWWKFWIKED